MRKTRDANKSQNNEIFKYFEIVFLAAFLVLFAYFLIQHRSFFPDRWFPSRFAATAFLIIYCAWILSELINSIWSKKNSQKTNQDKGSLRVILAATNVGLIIVFFFRNLDIGVFNGGLQYVGLILLVVGIVLREWSIWVLGRHFTVRVQVRERAKLVKRGPYKYIRHPAYTGSLLTSAGIPLAIGTWVGVIIVFFGNLIAYEYRIRVEEEALQAAFGSEYDEYKKRTWKLFPGF